MISLRACPFFMDDNEQETQRLIGRMRIHIFLHLLLQHLMSRMHTTKKSKALKITCKTFASFFSPSDFYPLSYPHRSVIIPIFCQPPVMTTKKLGNPQRKFLASPHLGINPPGTKSLPLQLTYTFL